MSVIPGACDQCKATGLPILPVRYTVVPATAVPGLPSWASGERVSSVDVGGEFMYALRTSRTGFIYLFYSKHARGNSYWECYSVCQDGSLILQPSPLAAQPYPGPQLLCSNISHVAGVRHCLVIEKPEKCGPTWIAFSEHKWSQEAVRDYTHNTRLRNARMQTIHPAEMIKGAKHSHGAIATKDSLEQVLEYAPSLNTFALPHSQEAGSISAGEDGRHEPDRLGQASTRYPWALRTGMAEATAAQMQLRAQAVGGKGGSPHVLALWDAIGIAHELNGYRNDAAGWIAKYGQERALQITAANAIGGIRRGLEDQAHRQIDRVRALAQPMSARETRARVGLRSAPTDSYWTRELAEAQTERQRDVDAGAAHAQQFRRTYVAQAWPKYQTLLDMGALRTFTDHWDEFRASADAVIDHRTIALIHWLEAPLFIDTLEDFHQQSISDGVLFEDAVGEACFGMDSSPAGKQKIDDWVKEAKASAKGNLLWRVVALNHEQGIAEVDAALRHVYTSPETLTLNAWEAAERDVKWNKLEDLLKKSLGFFNTQMRALNDPHSGIAAVGNSRGLEKIFMTAGSAMLKPLAQMADTFNESVLRTLLMVRSGVDPLAAKALVGWDIAHAATSRDEFLRRLRNNDHYLSASAIADYERQSKLWADLRRSADVPDARRHSFNAARDARLALVVAMFEAFNLRKVKAKAAKQPDSERVQLQLWAAVCATGSAVVDVLSNFVKGIAGDGAVSYQMLKGLGGGLSVVASLSGAYLDHADFERTRNGADYRLATMYFVRGAFQSTSAALTLLTALSYCSPLIETFGQRFGQRILGHLLTSAAERLLLARAALALASLEVSIFLLAVSLTIWGYEDNALEAWCRRCAFGANRKTLADAYVNAEEQNKAGGEALREAL